LMAEVRKVPDLVVILVQARLSNSSWVNTGSVGICGVRVPPLDEDATRQFLQRRLADNKITATAEQIRVLVERLNGYPPAVNMATTYAKEYGIELLVKNEKILTNFQQQEFADLLDQLHLSNIEWGILRILASGMELPLGTC